MDDTINLRTLKKNDENIEEILASAGQVAIYKYEVERGTWTRKDIEGPLFFVRRKGAQEYGFFVINRLNTINLSQRITADLETSVAQPYLMYKNPDNEIYCIWFYDNVKLVMLNDKITHVINKLKAIDETSKTPNRAPNGPSTDQQELLKMLLLSGKKNSTAPEFNKTSESKPNTARKSVNLADLFNTTAEMAVGAATGGGPLQPTFKAYPTVDDRHTGGNLKQASAARPQGGDLPVSLAKPEQGKKTTIASKTKPSDTVDTLLPTLESLNLKKVTSFLTDKTTGGSVSPANGNASSSARNGAPYLTMEQLKQTMVYLLQNDADFLHKIHSTYHSLSRTGP